MVCTLPRSDPVMIRLAGWIRNASDKENGVLIVELFAILQQYCESNTGILTKTANFMMHFFVFLRHSILSNA